MRVEQQVFGGIGVSPGIAIGPVTVFDRRTVPIARRRIDDEEVSSEITKLQAAVAKARAEVERLRDSLPQGAGADHRLLLETQILMHGDDLLLRSAIRTIKADHVNAEWALRRTVDAMRSSLAKAEERYFRERADDVALVGENILRVLTGASRTLPALSEPTILVASDLTPAEAAQLTPGALLGLVTDAGSATSHTAILARALQVPALVGIPEVTRVVSPGDVAIVDALRGRLTVRPEPVELERAKARASRFVEFQGRLQAVDGGAAETTDGRRIMLNANVELELDVEHAKRSGVDGVGLFRTEFLYLDRSAPPPEAEQYAVYSRVAKRMAPRPVTFRTFDFGADKLPNEWRHPVNPALGLRALRVAFERPELLVTQLKALLRAAHVGNVKVMFPMVSGLRDLRRAKALLATAREDLEAEGATYGPMKVGSMLEVPSALVTCDRLVHECDFFSVGTNDLTQYLLAVDRNDPSVAHFARSLDPSVLRMLDTAQRVAAGHEVPVSVCGDLAADPAAIPILLGLGFRELSMPLAASPAAREVVRRISFDRARDVAQRALEQDDAEEIERLVANQFSEELGELWAEHGIELPRH